MRWAFIFAMAWLALVRCGSEARRSDAPPLILQRWAGQYASSSQPSTVVARTQAQWAALWKDIGNEVPRAFNASRELAVAVLLGQRPSGGYKVEITAIRQVAGTLRVEYREYSAAANDRVTHVITTPWTVVMVTRSSLPIEFMRVKGREKELADYRQL